MSGDAAATADLQKAPFPPELSIVMPCLNETESVGACIDKARLFLQKNQVAGEIVIADNGSTDGSSRIAAERGARVVPVPVPGYGSALLGGMAAARGKFLILGDADDSYDFTALGPFLEKLREGYDLVVGNRFQGGVQPGAMPTLHRFLGNPVLSAIGRLLFHSPVGDFHCGLRGISRAALGRLFFHAPVRDFHCGLRAFDRRAITALNLRTTGMEFASEMVVKANLNGLRVTEVPTTLSPDGRTRAPHLRSWRDGWRHLRFLLIYSPRWLFLYPGFALALAGAVVGAWLLPGPRRVGSVTFDVHTLLYAALAVLIGFQAVIFAVFTKVFGVTEGLLPPDPRLNRLFRYVTLEVGLIAGAVLIVAGLAGSLYAVHVWRARSFGPLEPAHTLRTIIPAILSLVLGCQVVLSSFFLSVLGLRRRHTKLP